jgi:hypothetical protein
VIDVPNDQLKLKPGMTANVNVEIARSGNALRVPNAALRFRPTNEIFAAIGQTPPDPSQLRADFGGGRRGGAPASPNQNAAAQSTTPPVAKSGAPTAAAPTPPAGSGRAENAAADGQSRSNDARGPRDGAAGGTGRGDATEALADRYAARMQNMTPEERTQRLQRMRERGFDPTAAGGRNVAGNAATTAGTNAGPNTGPQRGRGAGRGTPSPAAAPASTRAGGATTIDALFGPLPRVESPGRAWLYVEKQLKPVRLRLGISDGQNTEVLDGDVQPGTELVTNVALATDTTRPPATNFPFGQPGRGGPGGFPGGGGNRGGGGAAGGRGR